jgi:hypothetical protein
MAAELLEDPSSIPAEPSDTLLWRGGSDVSNGVLPFGELPARPHSAMAGASMAADDANRGPLQKQLSVDSVLPHANSALDTPYIAHAVVTGEARSVDTGAGVRWTGSRGAGGSRPLTSQAVLQPATAGEAGAMEQSVADADAGDDGSWLGDRRAAATTQCALGTEPVAQSAVGFAPLTSTTIDELRPGDGDSAEGVDEALHAQAEANDALVEAGPNQLPLASNERDALAEPETGVTQTNGRGSFCQLNGAGGRGGSPAGAADEGRAVGGRPQLSVTDVQVATSILHVMVRLALSQQPAVVAPRTLMAALRDHPSVRTPLLDPITLKVSWTGLRSYRYIAVPRVVMCSRP